MKNIASDLLVLEKRANGIREWLRENGDNCFEEQKHLEEGSTERVYWHYGYRAALIDAINYLDDKKHLV